MLKPTLLYGLNLSIMAMILIIYRLVTKEITFDILLYYFLK